jgi:hypothetical protein
MISTVGSDYSLIQLKRPLFETERVFSVNYELEFLVLPK